MRPNIRLILFCFVLSISSAFGTDQKQNSAIIGIKIYDYTGDFKQLFDAFAGLGINAVFASETLVSNSSFRDHAKAQAMQVFLISPTFYDPEALKADPTLYAITRTGERAKEDWVEFVCPSRDEYRKQKVEKVRQAVAKLQPDGLSIDFIRHFVFWEMVRPERTYSSLPNTCFCKNCLTKFSSDTKITLPADTASSPQKAADWIEANQQQRWTEWKSNLITSMVSKLVTAAKKERPAILINIHAVPWRKSDYDGAIKKIAGQDFAALSRFANYLSPMCYSSMLHRDSEWIHSVVEDIASTSLAPVLPSIQVSPAYPDDLAVNAAEFEKALKAALLPPSKGVVFWNWDHLSKDPEKRAVVKRLIR